jgi:hypothetical protein
MIPVFSFCIIALTVKKIKGSGISRAMRCDAMPRKKKVLLDHSFAAWFEDLAATATVTAPAPRRDTAFCLDRERKSGWREGGRAEGVGR